MFKAEDGAKTCAWPKMWEGDGQASPRELPYRHRTADHLSDWLHALLVYLPQPGWRFAVAICSPVDRKAVIDHSIRTARCCSISQAVGKIWQQPFDIGQRVVRDVGSWLPRR